MKITRDQLDLADACGARVFLDGIVRCRVVAAAEEARTVEMLKHNGRNFVLNAAGDDVETEVLTGDVAIVLHPGAPPALVAMLQGKATNLGGPVKPGQWYRV